MRQIYTYDCIVPVVDPAAFVHETAVIIGGVIIGADCYIGPGAVLRGDFAWELRRNITRYWWPAKRPSGRRR